MHSSLPILRIHYLVLNFSMIGGCYDLVGYIDPRSPYSVILPVVLLHKNNKRHKNELNDKYKISTNDTKVCLTLRLNSRACSDLQGCV